MYYEAAKCHHCMGTGVEPDCKTCNNTGSVRAFEGHEFYGAHRMAQQLKPCYSCKRGDKLGYAL
jgi:DnaJ-class molecular chaperone